MHPVKSILSLGLVLAIFCACGGKEDTSSADCLENCLGDGEVVKATSSAVEIAFEKAAAGQEFVILPYMVGDMTTVDGATTLASSFTFSATVTAEPSTLIEPANVSTGMSIVERDAKLRTLLNRFDLSLDDQGEQFWAIARELDNAPVKYRFIDEAKETLPVHGGIESFYRKRMNSAKSLKNSNYNLTTAECPSSTVIVPSEDDPTGSDYEPDEQDIGAAQVFDGGDYCLVTLSDPVSEPEVDKVKETISAVLTRFKAAIYDDDFASVEEYTFKPVVVIVDVSDGSLWPDAEDYPAYQVLGAFLKAHADSKKRPYLYIASDVTKLGISADIAKKAFHSTIAHEMQHAVMDYYRIRVGEGEQATLAIDEGLAYLMEDIFGNGANVFVGFAKEFLATFRTGLDPFLMGSTYSDGSRNAKGPGHALMYYLVSQKGGLKYKEGIISSGGGLAFLRSVVKDAKNRGAQNLMANYGGDWVETVGNYLGSLVLDGTNAELITEKYKTQPFIEGVADLVGGLTNQYGMSFNGFGGITGQVEKFTKSNSEDLIADGLELTLYNTIPIHHTVTNQDDKLTFGLPEIDNIAFSVVRVK